MQDRTIAEVLDLLQQGETQDPAQFSTAWGRIFSTDGIEMLEALCDADSDTPGRLNEGWIRRKVGQLVAAGRTPQAVHAMTAAAFVEAIGPDSNGTPPEPKDEERVESDVEFVMRHLPPRASKTTREAARMLAEGCTHDEVARRLDIDVRNSQKIKSLYVTKPLRNKSLQQTLQFHVSEKKIRSR